MNETISIKIEQIKNKFTEFQIALAHEKSENNKVQAEKELFENRVLELEQMLAKSTSELLSSNEYLEASSKDLESVRNELKMQQEQIVVKKHAPPYKDELEIDFIVREIDACINQIKTSL